MGDSAMPLLPSMGFNVKGNGDGVKTFIESVYADGACR